ncbi:MAG TPA: preprotein translocase subunit SecE [Candidatus Paceibacterota bacterium]|nr:preprotein translocase subunit SecE [Candidatus Paceibacterota bacterium]
MAGPGQYLKDTRTELRHVAWPTRTQTIVYTILILAISVSIALYLGLFDFIFTQALSRVAGAAVAQPQSQDITSNPAIEISTTTTQ